MTYNFNLMNWVYRKQQIIEKNINKITFHFVEEGPGRGSEDIMRDRLIFLLFCLYDGHHGWKNHNKLKRTALK